MYGGKRGRAEGEIFPPFSDLYKERTNLMLSITKNSIVILINEDQLESGTKSCPELSFFDINKNDYLEIKITDKKAWLKSIFRELGRESEDGTTLVHLMLDTAIKRAFENGEEGILIESKNKR